MDLEDSCPPGNRALELLRSVPALRVDRDTRDEEVGIALHDPEEVVVRDEDRGRSLPIGHSPFIVATVPGLQHRLVDRGVLELGHEPLDVILVHPPVLGETEQSEKKGVVPMTPLCIGDDAAGSTVSNAEEMNVKVEDSAVRSFVGGLRGALARNHGARWCDQSGE